MCNSLLQLNGTFPYYYIYENTTNVIYITHIILGSDRGITVETNDSRNFGPFNILFQNKNFKCDNNANYENNTITFSDDYKIEVPINNEQTIILKSTTDISQTDKQKNEVICTIYDETLKIARPYQVLLKINIIIHIYIKYYFIYCIYTNIFIYTFIISFHMVICKSI